MMDELPFTFSDLHNTFLNNGYHVVRRSDRFWIGLWTDLTIEQVLMRSLKTRGGLISGRGMSENRNAGMGTYEAHLCTNSQFNDRNYRKLSQDK